MTPQQIDLIDAIEFESELTNFQRENLQIWLKENPMIKKEGNEMIESMNLIDLYAIKHLSLIHI